MSLRTSRQHSRPFFLCYNDVTTHYGVLTTTLQTKAVESVETVPTARYEPVRAEANVTLSKSHVRPASSGVSATGGGAPASQRVRDCPYLCSAD